MSSVQWLFAILKINGKLYKIVNYTVAMKCAHLVVSGRVQGVSFRANVRNKANELDLKGYVKNLENGDVEVVAEGNEEKIKEFIDFIKKGPGIAKVTNVKMRHKEPENFKNFEIRR
jgi:acylphosphatase